MAASYPTSQKTFTVPVDGVDYPKATDITDIQLEVSALEAEIGSSSDGATAVFARIANQTEDTTHPSSDFIGTSAGKKIGLIDAFSVQLEARYFLLSPLDSTTYYFGGGFISTAQTTANTRPQIIRRTGTIYAIDLIFSNEGTLASTETFSAWFRLNNTTDTLISSACQMDTAWETFSNASLGIAITSGDTFEIKYTAPVFATNPTNVRGHAAVWMR